MGVWVPSVRKRDPVTTIAGAWLAEAVAAPFAGTFCASCAAAMVEKLAIASTLTPANNDFAIITLKNGVRVKSSFKAALSLCILFADFVGETWGTEQATQK